MRQGMIRGLLLAGMVGPSMLACRGSGPAEPANPEPPPLTAVSETSTDLMFRFRSPEGEVVTATAIADIPESARGAVQVIDLSLPPDARGAGAWVQVFDLRAAGADGRFPGRLVPRAELEAALADEQRAARTAQRPVTMYSTSWCGVCKKARAFMQKEGIAFVEKDVEKDPAAAAELARKGGQGSVPVFDVDGRILAGFEPSRLLQAVRQPAEARTR